MALIGLLVAVEIVLNRFLSINAWNIKVGFQFVPVVVGAMVFGPVGGALVGGLGDFIGALLFPIGAYFPGFTVTAALMGAVFGLFLHNRELKAGPLGLRAEAAFPVLINQLILGLLLNSLFISILYGSPYVPLLYTRILQCAVLIPVQYLVTLAIKEALFRTGIIRTFG